MKKRIKRKKNVQGLESVVIDNGKNSDTIKLSKLDSLHGSIGNKSTLRLFGKMGDTQSENKISKKVSGHEESTLPPEEDTSIEHDECRQLELLLENIKFLIMMRDTYRDAGGLADDEKHLTILVNEVIRSEYPNVKLTDDSFMDRHAGGYDPNAGTITMPSSGVGDESLPLNQWLWAGLNIHERVHKQDIEGNPRVRKLLVDEYSQLEYYGSVDVMQKDIAKIVSQLEFHAYNEQVRYLRDIFNDKFNESFQCRFDRDFFSKYIGILEDA